MTIDRRMVVGAGLLLPVTPALAGSSRIFTPEQFGAKGDGRTNDSVAMAKLSAAVTANGGGTVVFRRTTYVVGAQGPQRPGDFYMYQPQDLLKFTGCTAPLELLGNGAKLQCAPGLRYGVFDQDGNPAKHDGAYLGPGLAAPYAAMIYVGDCTGPVRISDFDLAGPADNVVLGGTYGDTGWQIPATGLILKNNRGAETVIRVRANGHPQDGILIDGVDPAIPGVARTLTDISADGNGRQGCSITGGHGYRFVRGSFSRTGRGKIHSQPGAGVDIEAERKQNRDLSFEDCKFIDNAGCGMVADTGDSAQVRFSGCTFVGTTNWSAWPSKPYVRFDHCSFVGAIVRAYGDDDPARAAQFVECQFSDDPAKSPTGQVYGGTNTDRPLADLSDAQNVLFDRCTFSALHGGVLPWSTRVIYRDCTMVAGMKVFGFPRGRYEGVNRIDGLINATGSTVPGSLIVNGKEERDHFR